ncbi:MAG: glycosyltransferase [Pirellulales bacterium]|nr:glycosyltransferase [Pirellulales bacterium]
MKGGVQQVTSLLLTYLPDVIFHASVRSERSKCKYTLFSVLAYFRFVYLLMRRRPCLVHVLICSPFDQIRNLPYIFISRFVGLPVVLQFHYDIAGAYLKLFRMVRWITSRAYRGSQLLCFLSKTLRDDFSNKVGQFPCAVVPNPVPVDYLKESPLPYEDREYDVVYLGRLMPEKGVPDLMAAAKLDVVGSNHGTPRYYLWGDGIVPKDRPYICCFQMWIEDPEKREIFRKAKVVVLPSYQECFPMVLLEAMACGTPVVATPVGGVPDMIKDGMQGILVEPGQPQQLHQAIHRLLDDPQLWRECSCNARTSANQYALPSIGKLWMELYAEIVSAKISGH